MTVIMHKLCQNFLKVSRKDKIFNFLKLTLTVDVCLSCQEAMAKCLHSYSRRRLNGWLKIRSVEAVMGKKQILLANFN